MAEKRGRPTMDVGRKTNKITIRLSNEELRHLVVEASKKGVTKTEIIKQALEIYFNMLKNRY